MFFAGFVAGPWLWLIGGWLLGPAGTTTKSVRRRGRQLDEKSRSGSGRDEDVQEKGLDYSKDNDVSPKDTEEAVSTVLEGTVHLPTAFVRSSYVDSGRKTTGHPPVPTIRVEDRDQANTNADLELGLRSWKNLAFFTTNHHTSQLDLSLTPYPAESGSRLSISLMDAFPKPPSNNGRLGRLIPTLKSSWESEESVLEGRSALKAVLRRFRWFSPIPAQKDAARSGPDSLPPRVVPFRSDTPNPWVWRCRVAAVAAAVLLSAALIVAVVEAVGSRR